MPESPNEAHNSLTFNELLASLARPDEDLAHEFLMQAVASQERYLGIAREYLQSTRDRPAQAGGSLAHQERVERHEARVDHEERQLVGLRILQEGAQHHPMIVTVCALYQRTLLVAEYRATAGGELSSDPYVALLDGLFNTKQ